MRASLPLRKCELFVRLLLRITMRYVISVRFNALFCGALQCEFSPVVIIGPYDVGPIRNFPFVLHIFRFHEFCCSICFLSAIWKRRLQQSESLLANEMIRWNATFFLLSLVVRDCQWNCSISFVCSYLRLYSVG